MNSIAKFICNKLFKYPKEGSFIKNSSKNDFQVLQYLGLWENHPVCEDFRGNIIPLNLDEWVPSNPEEGIYISGDWKKPINHRLYSLEERIKLEQIFS